MKKLVKILSLIIVLTVLGACGNSSTSDSEGSSSSEGSEKLKDTITVAITAEPPTLDPPMTVSNAALDIAIHFYETLYTMDENYTPQPMLAESYEANEDNTEYTFTLRDGVLFHNGEEMTAEDVVASMNYWLERSEKAQNLDGGSFEKVDDSTVKVTFNSPANDFLTLISSRSTFPAIRPASVIEGADDTGVQEHIGTGPYQFVEWQHDQFVRLEAFEDYQPREEEPSAYAGYKEAKTPYIVYEIIPDAGTRVSGILSGTYDVATEIPADNYDQMSNDESLNVLTEGGGTLVASLNTTEGPLADVNVRKAIEVGIDNDSLTLAAYGNPELSNVHPNFMNPQSALYGEVPELSYYNQKDAAQAQEFLDQSDYNGETITLLATPDYQEMYNATIALQEQLTSLGINAVIDEYDFSTFMERKGDTANWDIYITSNGYQVIPNQTLALTPSWANHTDEQFVAYLDQIQSSTDEEERSETYRELVKYIYDEYVSSIVFTHFNNFIVTTDNVEGITFWQTPILWNTVVSQD